VEHSSKIFYTVNGLTDNGHASRLKIKYEKINKILLKIQDLKKEFLCLWSSTVVGVLLSRTKKFFKVLRSLYRFFFSNLHTFTSFPYLHVNNYYLFLTKGKYVYIQE
jgi:hypothetical protein